MRWFRFYPEALNDPKVQQLPAALFRQWINVLCIAAERDGDDWGSLPPMTQLAYQLRKSEAATATLVDRLSAAGLLDHNDGIYSPHNWAKRQFRSDDVNARVKKHRQRPRNVSRNGIETPPEYRVQSTETDSPKGQAPPAFRDRYLAAQTVPQRLAACIDHWPHELEPQDKNHLGGLIKRLGGGQDAVMKLSGAMGAIEPLRYLEGVLKNGKAERTPGRSKEQATTGADEAREGW